LNDRVTAAVAEFDVDAWTDQLFALNPWARTRTINESEEAFCAARLDATLHRYTEGEEAWNAWARGMLDLCWRLQEAGGFVATEKGAELSGNNEQTTAWLETAKTCFGNREKPYTFATSASFENFIFPGEADFRRAVFPGETQFSDAHFWGDAWFNAASFLGDVWFGGTFERGAHFSTANFSKAAWFFIHVLGETSFDGAIFGGDAWFIGATFSGGASFAKATFENDANFGSVLLDQSGSRFCGPVDLSWVKCRGALVLEECTFERNVTFQSIHCETSILLTRARFREVPNLLGASLRGTLRLDDVVTPKYWLLGWTRDKDASARFRELRRRASEAQDHEREIEFFAQELRTLRFHPLSPRLPRWTPRIWEWRFWMGILYGTFSNFGRSFIRPIGFWVFFTIATAVYYLAHHPNVAEERAKLSQQGLGRISAYASVAHAIWLRAPPYDKGVACVPKGADDPKAAFARTDAVHEALYLAGQTGLIVLGATRPEATRRSYGCLYGLEGDGPSAAAIVPYGVSVISTLHTLGSGFLIFLLLLAIRNLLKIK
jgi:uncharacterized protein YjbI with pentapeptide repeats